MPVQALQHRLRGGRQGFGQGLARQQAPDRRPAATDRPGIVAAAAGDDQPGRQIAQARHHRQMRPVGQRQPGQRIFLQRIGAALQNDGLRRMGRQYTIEHYLERLDRIRDAVPEIAISTDVIVGFCGETEAQFNGTKGPLATYFL